MSCMTNCSGDAGYLSGVGSETDYGCRILLIFSMLCVAFLKPADRLWTRVILFTAFEAIYFVDYMLVFMCCQVFEDGFGIPGVRKVLHR